MYESIIDLSIAGYCLKYRFMCSIFYISYIYFSYILIHISHKFGINDISTPFLMVTKYDQGNNIIILVIIIM